MSAESLRFIARDKQTEYKQTDKGYQACVIVIKLG